MVRYFAYAEIRPNAHQSLWQTYTELEVRFPNFAMQTIETLADIFPVFRRFLVKKAA